MTMVDDTRTMLRRAIAGESLIVDREHYSLHDLTQIAIALQPGAHMAIRNADLMSPIERASVETASTGRVVFV